MTTRAETYEHAQVPPGLPLTLGLAALALVGLLLSNFNPHLLFHMVLFLIGLGIAWRMAPAGEARLFMRVYLVGYLVRTLAVVIVQALSPDGLMFFDDRGYDEQARYLGGSWSLSKLNYAQTDLGTTHTGYPILLGTLYGWLGPSVFSGKMLSAFFGALTAPIAYFLTLEVIGDKNNARAAAWLTALFLYDVMWAGFLMKDTILLFLFSTSLLVFIKAAKRPRPARLLACFVLVALLQSFRFYSIAAIALAGVAALIVRVSESSAFQTTRSRVRFGIVLLGITVCLLWLAFVYYGDTIDALAVYSQAIDQFQTTPNPYSLLHFTPTFSFLQEAIRATLVYQLGPFPWVFSGVAPVGMLFYPGMYLIYCLLPFFLLGFAKMANQITPLKAFLLTVIVLHAAAEIFMYQAGERQRVMTDVIFVICAMVGWNARGGRQRFVLGTYIAIFAFAVVHTLSII